jgi:hypothetical protein
LISVIKVPDMRTYQNEHIVVFSDIRAVSMTVCWHHLLFHCFSLVILNFLIWQFTLTRQIDKFKLLPIISYKICNLIRIPTMT